MSDEKYKFESLEARATWYELEYEKLHRRVYGSGNSTIHNRDSTVPEENKGFIFFSSKTNFGLLRQIALFNRIIIGGRFNQKVSTKGNKRLGRKFYYFEILKCFLELKRQGIKLPKNVLSQRACAYGLIEVLRAHKKIPPAIANKTYFNSLEREKIRKSNESAFTTIIKNLQKRPPVKILIA